MGKSYRIFLVSIVLLALFGLFAVIWVPARTIIIVTGTVLVLVYYCIRKRPALFSKLVLVLVSACLSIILVEFLGRLTLEKFLYYREHEMLVEQWPPLPLLLRYKANSRVSRQSFGDLAAISGDKNLEERRQVVFATDSFGFRNYPRGDDAVYDLVLLGDSMTVGIGTTQEEIWANQLGRRYRVQAYNLAMPGSPWVSYMNLCVQLNHMKIHPHSAVLLAIFSGNDLDESYGPVYNLVDLPWRDSLGAFGVSVSNFRKCSVLYRLARRVFVKNPSPEKVVVQEFLDGKKILFFKPYVDNRNRSTQDVLSHPNFPRFVETLKAIDTVTQRRTLPLKIVLFPSKEQVYSWVISGGAPWSTSQEPSGLSTILREFCQSREIAYLDLKPFLLAASRETFERSGELLWWHDDSHWNAKGHEIAAKLIYENLLKNGN